MLGILKIALRLRDRHIFMWKSVEILNVFNTATLKQIFWKTKNFFKKMEYRFLVKSTKIENTPFLYKTAKERSFVNNYFFFWKFCFSLRNSYSYKALIWCSNDPNAYISTFCKRWSFSWLCFFPVSILSSCIRVL